MRVAPDRAGLPNRSSLMHRRSVPISRLRVQRRNQFCYLRLSFSLPYSSASQRRPQRAQLCCHSVDRCRLRDEGLPELYRTPRGANGRRLVDTRTGPLSVTLFGRGEHGETVESDEARSDTITGFKPTESETRPE